MNIKNKIINIKHKFFVFEHIKNGDIYEQYYFNRQLKL